MREAVVSGIDAHKRREVHRALAEALELGAGAPAERLAYHWNAAGSPAKAVHWAVRAADDARSTLDFSRAADFLGLAIEHGDHSPEERGRLLLRWGDTLVEAGRAADAIDVFEQALAGAAGEQRLAVRLRLVQQLLALGNIEQGLDAADELTRSVGWKLPRSSLMTLVRIVANDVALRWSTRKPLAQKEPQHAARLRRRVDITSALARSLSMTDSVRGVVCSQRAIRDGLRLDDAELTTRLLVMRTVGLAARGKKDEMLRCLEHAEEWAKRSGSQACLAYTGYGWGWYYAAVSHHWGRAVDHLDEAVRSWREAGRGEGWDLDSVKMLLLTARAMHGDLRATNHTLPQATLQYARSGRRFLEVMVRTKHGLHPTLADRPQAAITDVEDALSMWPDKDDAYLLQHFYGLLSLAQADLYMGRPELAFARLRDDERALARSQLMKVLAFRMEHEYLQGRVHIALALQAEASARDGHCKRARRHARKLERMGFPMAVHYAAIVRAGLANIRGDEDAVLDHLRGAASGFDDIESRVFSALVKRRLGTIIGGDEGAKLVSESELWMAREDVNHPARATDLFLPGWPRD